MIDNNHYYDTFAHTYEAQRHHGYHALIDQLELAAITPLVRDRTVLEIGCGTGLIMKELTGSVRRIQGIDASAKMLEKARERHLDVQLATAEDLPFEDAQFDVVYSFKVLAHIERIGRAMEEAVRVLKPGGVLLAEFYNALSLRYLCRLAGGARHIGNTLTEDDVFTRWDTPRQVRSYIPHGAVFDGFYGVRVVTPSAILFNLPLTHRLFRSVEKRASTSPLAVFGGFLIAKCHKSTHP